MTDNDAAASVRLLREAQVAELLAVKVSTLRRWRWSGDGPHFIKIGAAVRYAPDDLEVFVAARRRRSTSDTESQMRPESDPHGQTA